MGMGYSACTAWTIDDKDCQKLCRKPWNNMMAALADKNMSLDELAQTLNWDGEVPDYILDALNAFTKAFEKKTGLPIGLYFHNADEEGDRYDDINGHYWDLSEVSRLTPKAKKLGKKIRFSTWVNFG